ncbi:hypothetical protein HYFRA_00005980 [Hymenoscyphus fraxineus]|uniref:Uncharacterized protein n=1 Tax=Hymenoscyphus fraxineus TaxID=746836 RepID=A0A9N9KV71_9HELO|nr:hypothetical protein HYFRA_00005980 [Hymenoscyphus fraxineus]
MSDNSSKPNELADKKMYHLANSSGSQKIDTLKRIIHAQHSIHHAQKRQSNKLESRLRTLQRSGGMKEDEVDQILRNLHDLLDTNSANTEELETALAQATEKSEDEMELLEHGIIKLQKAQIAQLGRIEKIVRQVSLPEAEEVMIAQREKHDREMQILESEQQYLLIECQRAHAQIVKDLQRVAARIAELGEQANGGGEMLAELYLEHERLSMNLEQLQNQVQTQAALYESAPAGNDKDFRDIATRKMELEEKGRETRERVGEPSREQGQILRELQDPSCGTLYGNCGYIGKAL